MYRKGLKYSYFIVLYYLFIFRDIIQSNIPVFGLFDEAVATFAIVLFFYRLVNNDFKIKTNNLIPTRFFFFFFLIGAISSVINNIQPLSTCFADAFLCAKFWLTLYLGYAFFNPDDLQNKGQKIGYHVILITIIYAVLFVIDNFIVDLFPTFYRYGFKTTQLFYSHPTTFAANCVFLIALSFFIKDNFKFWKVCVFIQLILLCTTFRSKAIAAALAIVLIYYFAYIRKKRITIRTLILFIPIVLAIAWEQIEFYFFSNIRSDSARFQLTRVSFEIAMEYFPFGAGFGTFASAYSVRPYSPLYSTYRISNVNGLIEGASDFVSDNFWPMIIGQFGFLGLVIMLLIVLYLFKRIQSIKEYSLAGYVSALSIFVYLIICSMAESAFVHPNSVSLALLLGCILGFINNRRKVRIDV